MRWYQFGIGTLLFLMFAVGVICVCWPYVVPNAIAIVKMGGGWYLAGFVAALLALAFGLVRSFRLS